MWGFMGGFLKGRVLGGKHGFWIEKGHLKTFLRRKGSFEDILDRFRPLGSVQKIRLEHFESAVRPGY